MFKRIFQTLLMILAFGGNAFAHAVVTESSLREHPIEVNQATEVVLDFNSNVEIALSKVFLVSKGDVYQPLKMSKAPKKGSVRIHVPALAAGDYALKYKVFAADGHLTEDVIRFNVSAPR